MRNLLRVLTLLSLALFAHPAAAQNFPDRTVKLIVPWAAGGPADAGFRILGESVARRLGQPVVVENKGGASGVMGAMALQDAKPDGERQCQQPGRGVGRIGPYCLESGQDDGKG